MKTVPEIRKKRSRCTRNNLNESFKPFKNIDRYSSNVFMNIDGQEKIHTAPGICFTWFIFIIIILYVLHEAQNITF